MKKLQLLLIHCTATIEGREISSDLIRAMHTAPPPKGRGWKQVGYSHLIHLDGTIEELVDHNEDDWVDPWEMTNGAEGINSISRHIVYAGGLDRNKRPKDTRTIDQLHYMEWFVKDFLLKHPTCKVAGHYQFANKACPSFHVPGWLLQIGVNQKNIYTK